MRRMLKWWKRHMRRQPAVADHGCTSRTLSVDHPVDLLEAPVRNDGERSSGNAHNNNSSKRNNVMSGSTALRHHIEQLPDDAATVVLSFLDNASLSLVVACCDHNVFYDHWTRHVWLRIPPDVARHEPLLQSLTASESERRATPRPIQFAVVSTYQLGLLHGIRHDVRGLAVDARGYADWPEMPFEPAALAFFPQLTRLEIHHAGRDFPIDLQALAQAAPQLESLTITNVHSLLRPNHLAECTRLRELRLENTTIDASLSVAVGLHKLTSLHVETPSIRAHRRPRLEDIVPLTTLVLHGGSDAARRQRALVRHVPTLRTLDVSRLSTATMAMCVLTPRARHLTTLRLGRNPLVDLELLLLLPQLEQLQLVVSATASHCRPLQRLANLRELWIANGWLCDLVGFWPRLTTLVCEEDTPGHARGRLGRRLEDRTATIPTPAIPRLRAIAIRGHVTIPHGDADGTDGDPLVWQMLQSVEQVELFHVHDLSTLLRTVATLPRVQRIAIYERAPSAALATSVVFASAALLKEVWIYVPPNAFTMRRLPVWLMNQFTALRVLATNLVVPIEATCLLPQQLTHLLMPCARSFLQPGESLPCRLRFLSVLSLSRHDDCAPFRRERGGLLPSLRSIRHPVGDCLWSSHCVTVLQEKGEFWDFGQDSGRDLEECRRVLTPTWGHPWSEA